jgi:hypothetical protein
LHCVWATREAVVKWRCGWVCDWAMTRVWVRCRSWGMGVFHETWQIAASIVAARTRGERIWVRFRWIVRW